MTHTSRVRRRARALPHGLPRPARTRPNAALALAALALGTACASPAWAQPVSPPARAAAVEPDPSVPAMEILAFQLLLNRANRYWGTGREDYRVTVGSIRRNLRSSWGTDNDPFKVNQFGHPYQGAMYHGFARSAGFDYWQSLGYAFAGSIVWEIAGENTRPSRNDQIASGIGGTFLGEALFRMSSLVLEQGGGLAGPWRRAAAAAIDPAAGFNRLVFADRYGGFESSRGAVYASELQFGYSRSVKRETGISRADFRPNEGQLRFDLDYGLPGRADYRYARPFDYFNFQGTMSSANGIESVLTRGLVWGAAYEPRTRASGVWGLYGSYDYVAPQTFRISTTALSIGTTVQWQPTEQLSVQGTGMAGIGYAAVGTRGGTGGDRDYNYGVAPQALLNLRVVYEDRFAWGITAREYFVSRVASGTSGGHDNIVRADASLTWRFAKEQALSLRWVGNRRDAVFGGPGTRRQTQVTAGLFYTLLGKDRFGTADWR